MLFVKAAKAISLGILFIPFTGCAIGVGLIFASLLKSVSYVPDYRNSKWTSFKIQNINFIFFTQLFFYIAIVFIFFLFIFIFKTGLTIDSSLLSPFLDSRVSFCDEKLPPVLTDNTADIPIDGSKDNEDNEEDEEFWEIALWVVRGGLIICLSIFIYRQF